VSCRGEKWRRFGEEGGELGENRRSEKMEGKWGRWAGDGDNEAGIERK
jgi:hypothetical protein